MDYVIDYLWEGKEKSFPLTSVQQVHTQNEFINITTKEASTKELLSTVKTLYQKNNFSTEKMEKEKEKVLQDYLKKQKENQPQKVEKETKIISESVSGWKQPTDFLIEEKIEPQGIEEPYNEDIPLKVVGYSPKDKVFNRPNFISIIFNKRITKEELQEGFIETKPKINGKLKVIGKTTVLFEPSNEISMSTEYQVKIKVKEKDIFSFKFITSPPRIIDYLPGSLTEIKQEEIIKQLRLVDGSILSLRWTSYPLKLLDVDKAKNLIESRYRLKKNTNSYESSLLELYEKRFREALGGRFIWFTIDNSELPLGYRYYLKLLPGTSGAEKDSSIKTTIEQGFKFKTHDKLFIESFEPNENLTCLPGQKWIIRFSNSISEDLNLHSCVKITPEIQGLNISLFENYISISGRTTPNTKYSIQFNSNLRDVFNGSYIEKKVVHFKIQESENIFLSSFQSGIIVMNPDNNSSNYHVITSNVEKFHLIVLKIKNPKESFHISPFGENFKEDKEKEGLDYVGNIGDVVFNGNIQTFAKMNQLKETKIDLKEFLKNQKTGHYFVHVYLPSSPYDYRISSWIQFTDISIDCIDTPSNILNCWINRLSDGIPIENAIVSMNNEKLDFKTNKDGLIILKPNQEEEENDLLIIAEFENDISFLKFKRKKTNLSNLLVFSNKTIFKSNENIQIFGYSKSDQKLTEIKYEIKNEETNSTIKSGSLVLDDCNSFEFNEILPKNNFGKMIFKFGKVCHEIFILQETKNEEEIILTLKTKNHLLKQFALLSAQVEPKNKLNDGKTFEWIIKQKKVTSFIPGNWKLFKFNSIDDVTNLKEEQEEIPEEEKLELEFAENKKHQVILHSNGKHELTLFFNENYQKKKENAVIQVSVKGKLKNEDLKFSTSKNEIKFIVHPSNLYVGLKIKKKVFKLNIEETISLEYIVSDINGKLIADVLVYFTIFLKKQKFDKEKRKMIFIEEEIRNLKKKSTDKVSRLDLNEIQKGGIYHVNALVVDTKTNLTNQSSVYFLVEKNEEIEEPKLIKKQNDIILISDKKNYFENDISQIFLQNKFNSPAHIFLISLREKIFSRQIFTLKNNYQMIKLKMESDYNPNVFIFALIVGKFSNFSTGQLKLNIFKKLTDTKQNEEENDIFKKELIFNSSHLFKKDLIISLNFDESKSENFTHEFEVEIKKKANDESTKKGEILFLLSEEDIFLNFESKKSSLENEIQNFSNRNFIYLEENWKKIFDEVLANEEEKEDTSEDFNFGNSIDEISENFDMIHDEEFQFVECKKERETKKYKNYFSISKKEKEVSIDKKTKISLNLPKNLQDFHVLVISNFPAENGKSEIFEIEKYQFFNSFPLDIQINFPSDKLFQDEICYFQIKLKKKKNFKNEINLNYSIKQDENEGEIEFLDEELNNQKIKFNEKEILLEIGIKCKKEGKKKIDIIFEIENNSMKFFNSDQNSMRIESKEFEIMKFEKTKITKISHYQQFKDNEIFTEKVSISKKFFKDQESPNLKFTISESIFSILQLLLQTLFNEKLDLIFDTSSRLLALNLVTNAPSDDSNLFTDYSKLNLTSNQIEKLINDSVKELSSKKLHNNENEAKIAWNLFSRESSSDLYLNLFIIHSILLSDFNGHFVSEETMKFVKNFLEKFEDILNKKIASILVKNTLKAYYYYIYLILNDNQSMIASKAKSLFLELGLTESTESFTNISLEGISWLMMVIHLSSTSNYLENEISIMKKILTKQFEYTNKSKLKNEEKIDLFHSNLKTKSIILSGLILIDPENEDVLNEVFGDLMKHFDQISNSIEISFLILTLKSFQNVIEVDDSLLKSVNVWLNENLLVEDTSFNSSKIINFNSRNLKKNEENNISFKKFGKGFLFFTVELFLTNQHHFHEKEEKKIFIEKRFEKLNSLVLTKKNEKYTIKRGDLIKVRIIVLNSQNEKNILIKDQIPNGFSFISFENILKTEDEKKDLKNHFNSNKIDFQESIENQIKIYIENLNEGLHEYCYILQASFKGEFSISSCEIVNIFSSLSAEKKTLSPQQKVKFEILTSPKLKK
eukprot:gene11648-4887_t